MKIAYILPHFYPYVGGGEKMFYDIAVAFQRAGHEVRVVTREVLPDYVGLCRIDGISVNYRPWKEMFGHPFPVKEDIEEVIEWCDIVHTSIFTTAPIVSKLARKYKKPAVLSIYEVRGSKWFKCDNFFKACIYYTVEQYTCRQKFDAYHAISEATKKDIRKYCNRPNVYRVYLANDMTKVDPNVKFSLREYFGLPETTPVFLYYGRPGRTKGIRVFAKAIERLLAKHKINTNYRFCFILGKEPEKEREQFLKYIRDKRLQKYIIVRDSVERKQLASCITQADCVVVPSLTEGFGYSALEACQLGARLIHSDGGSLAEVSFGVCRSFKNGDSSDLAEKLLKVMDDEPDAFSYVSDKIFSYSAMQEGIMNIYKKVLGVK